MRFFISIFIACFSSQSLGSILDWQKNEFPNNAITDGSGVQICSGEYNRDIISSNGAGLDSQLGALESCCTICASTPNCHGFSWSDYGGGTCWLKTVDGPPVLKDGTNAGYLLKYKNESHNKGVDFDKQHCTNLPGIDIQGGSPYGDNDGEYEVSCCELCSAIKACQAFTWLDGRCWYKTSFADQVKSDKPNLISGRLMSRPPPATTFPLWLPIVGGITLLVLLAGLTYASVRLFRERRVRRQLDQLEKLFKTKGDQDQLDPAVALSDQAELLEYKEQYEISRKNVRFMDKVLGSGSFGKVVLAEAQGLPQALDSTDAGQSIQPEQQQQAQWTKVAVKLVRNQGDIEQLTMLLKELKVHMFAGHHVNVVNLLASVTKNFRLGEMFVVLEYCGLGSLKEFLLKLQAEPKYFVNQVTADGQLEKLNLAELDKKRRALASSVMNDGLINVQEKSKSTSLDLVATTNDLISFSHQIACGMAYLAGRKVIHRDLAARNVLLTETLVAKISDFGLARKGVRREGTENDAEYLRLGTNAKDEPLPVKWLAPECVHHSSFSTASDVWAYGVTLWEIFALGLNPYANNPNSLEFIDKVTGGYRMQPPRYAPREMTVIMQQCWNIVPDERPNFMQLCKFVLPLVDTDKLDALRTTGEELQPVELSNYSQLADNQLGSASKSGSYETSQLSTVSTNLSSDGREKSKRPEEEAAKNLAERVSLATPYYEIVSVDIESNNNSNVQYGTLHSSSDDWTAAYLTIAPDFADLQQCGNGLPWKINEQKSSRPSLLAVSREESV